MTPVKKKFKDEVKLRQAEKEHTIHLTLAQRYVIRELRHYFGKTPDEDEKERINLLDKVFRATLYPTVIKELNALRRLGVTGEHLI